MNDNSITAKLRRVHSNVVVIEELWRMADSRDAADSESFKVVDSRTGGELLLTHIAQIGSFRRRIAILAELRKTGFLTRLFRETKTIGHRKRIVRSYCFAWLGEFAGGGQET